MQAIGPFRCPDKPSWLDNKNDQNKMENYLQNKSVQQNQQQMLRKSRRLQSILHVINIHWADLLDQQIKAWHASSSYTQCNSPNWPAGTNTDLCECLCPDLDRTWHWMTVSSCNDPSTSIQVWCPVSPDFLRNHVNMAWPQWQQESLPKQLLPLTSFYQNWRFFFIFRLSRIEKLQNNSFVIYETVSKHKL